MSSSWLQRTENTGAWLSNHAPTLATLALVIVIAFVLARLTWAVVPQPVASVAAGAPTVLVAQESAQPDPAAQARKIATLHLFGRAKISAENRGQHAPETHLNLTLRGIIAAGDTKHSRALIVAGNGSGKSYTIGASVPGGATVYAIYADRIILSRNGRLEALRLPRSDDSGTARISHVTGSSARPPVHHKLTRAQRSRVGPIVPGSHGLLRASRALVDGKFKGYSVYPGKSRKKFLAAGLRPGDIIEAANGQPLTHPGNLLVLARRLKKGKPVTVRILRDGHIQNLTISLPR